MLKHSDCSDASYTTPWALWAFIPDGIIDFQLVFLAMTCVFFRKEVSKLYTSNFRRCLKPFLDHTALFIGLVNATRALISGEILLDVLMGRKLPGGDYQMTLCVDNKLTAFTLMHHLVSIEGYSYMHDPCQPTIVDMCSAIHKKARSSPNVFDKHAYRPAVSSAKAIHSIHKSVDGNNVHIDVHSFEVASSHYQLTSTSGPRVSSRHLLICTRQYA